MENKIYKLTDEEFSNLVKSSLNISEVLFKLGYTTVGNSWGYSQVKQRMQNLTGEDFRDKSAIVQKAKARELSPEDLFKENCRYQRHVLRGYNLLPYKCAICGIS